MSKITLNPVGSLIDATSATNTINSNSATIVTAMDNTLSRDGTSPNQMGASIDMNGNQILNLPAPSTVNSPARVIDVVTNPTIVIPGTGTSGHVVPFLDGNNTFSGTNTFSNNTTLSGNNTFSGTNTFSTAIVEPAGANTVKGSIAGGNVADLTKTQITTLINPVTSTLSGAVPATGGGTVNFLRADGTFAPVTGYTLLNTLTASSSTTLTDSTSFTSAFSRYQIVMTNILPSVTNVTLSMLLIVGGVAQTSGYLCQEVHASGVGIATSAVTTFVPLGPTASVTGGNPGLSGIWNIADVASTTTEKHIFGQYSCLTAGPATVIGFTGGFYNGTNGAVTGFTVGTSSGVLTSGTIKVYGIT